jgi:hypothetical protein
MQESKLSRTKQVVRDKAKQINHQQNKKKEERKKERTNQRNKHLRKVRFFSTNHKKIAHFDSQPKSGVLLAVTAKTTAFLNVTPCSLVSIPVFYFCLFQNIITFLLHHQSPLAKRQ